MDIRLSNRHTLLLLVSSFVIALGVGSGFKLLVSNGQSSNSRPSEDVVDTSVPEDSESAFSQPFLPASSELQLPQPVILRSTPQEERVLQVAAGRSDPFAPITELQLSAKDEQPQQVAAMDQAAPPNWVTRTVPPIPLTMAPPLPALPTMPTKASTASSSAASLPPASGLPPLGNAASEQPRVSPPIQLSPVDGLEISGIVQLNGRVRVIIRDGGGNSPSRHVAVGERVAGGQVLIKRVDFAADEPVVVLEYASQEYLRSVGSASVAGLM